MLSQSANRLAASKHLPPCLHWLPAVLHSVKAYWVNLSRSCQSGAAAAVDACSWTSAGWFSNSAPFPSLSVWGLFICCSQFPSLSIISTSFPALVESHQHFYETFCDCFCFPVPHSFSLLWCEFSLSFFKQIWELKEVVFLVSSCDYTNIHSPFTHCWGSVTCRRVRRRWNTVVQILSDSW